MRSMTTLLVAAVLAVSSAFVSGAGLCEDFEGFQAGPAAGGGWRFMGAASSLKHARIADTGEPYYGKVLRVHPASGATPANTFDMDLGTPERIVVEFDMRVHGNTPAFTIALLNREVEEYAHVGAPERALFWMMADGQAKTLQVFTGSWRTIAKIANDQWHHVRVVCDLTGKEHPQTCDIYVDGDRPKVRHVPFRNALVAPGKGRSAVLYIAGRDERTAGEGKPDFYGDIDNLRVFTEGAGALPLPPMSAPKVADAPKMAAAGAVRVDFSQMPLGPAVKSDDISFGGEAAMTSHAKIVDVGGEHGKVMRINPSARAVGNLFRMKVSGKAGSVTASLDFFSQGSGESTTIALVPDKYTGLVANAAYTWLRIVPGNGRIDGFSGGWKKICDFTPGAWHHLEMTAYLSGDKANFYVVTLDGKACDPAPFRNFVSGKTTPGGLRIESREVKTYGADDYSDFDNIVLSVDDEEEAVADANAPKVVHGNFDSQVFGRKMYYTVLLPFDYDSDSAKRWPVLFLFHGRGRNNASVVSDADAFRLLHPARFVIAFPNGEDGWYINSPVNPNARYNDYIEEFVRVIDANFRVSTERSRRGLSGWSMGGYGCTRYAETHAQEFGALAPMIGLLDYPRTGLPQGQSYNVATNTFGNDEAAWKQVNPINDAASLQGMKILIAAADSAFDRTMNQNFDAKLNELGIAHDFQMVHGGHSFEAVKRCLEKVVDFMNTAIAAE